MSQMSLNERKAIHHLLWIWYEYSNDTHKEPKGFEAATALHLPHRNMQAGEQATDFLISLGLAIDQGYQCELTPAGLEIFNDESLSEK